MLFSQVIGQEQIKERLRVAVREGRIPHAQLFSGECGVGVLPLALAYAQYVACPNRTDTDACGKCPTCQKYEKLAHPDLHLVFPIVKKEKSEVCDTYMTKFSSFISKNPYANLFQWLSELGREEKNALIATNESEEIVKKMSLKSYEGGVKTMIVWMPEKMHLACSNKLLKLIEEPYPNTVIILVSYDPSQIIATIRSRTQLVMVPPISDADLSDYLKTEYEIKNALVSIPEKIKNGTIPYYDYGVVVNYLVAIKYEADIDFDIKLIVQPIIESLRNITEDIAFEALFSSGYTLYNNDGIVCFEQIKNQMKEVLCNDLIYTEFPYDPTLIKKYSNKCIKVSKESLKSSGFAHKIDVERFVEMLKKCSADIISELRSLFMHLYTDVHYSSIVNEDVKALKKLRDSITMLKDYNGYDKIQRMQIKWLDKNLSDIIAAYYARNEYTL